MGSTKTERQSYGERNMNQAFTVEGMGLTQREKLQRREDNMGDQINENESRGFVQVKPGPTLSSTASHSVGVASVFIFPPFELPIHQHMFFLGFVRCLVAQQMGADIRC